VSDADDRNPDDRDLDEASRDLESDILMAEGYARWWAPVIRPAAERVLDQLAPAVEAAGATDGTLRVLDVGSGTGTLAIAALSRWPALEVTGIDIAVGMLELARRTAEARLDGTTRTRYRTEVASADRLPFEAGTFDLAMSSFVLQLVPNRAAALREIRRVLRPGGTLAWVTWQRTDRAFEPDRVANEVLDDYGFDPPEPDPRNGDIPSPEAAVLAMRRAGFRDVQAHAAECVHRWDAAGYLAFLTEFDEESLFADLEADERREIEDRILERLENLAPEALTLQLPVVYATGRTAG